MVKRNSGTSKEDICQNQFTAYVVLAVKRKRQAYIKKKIRDKENQAKREEEQSNFGAEENTVWDRLEVQNEELVAAVQQLKPKARFIVTGYVLKGKTLHRAFNGEYFAVNAINNERNACESPVKSN